MTGRGSFPPWGQPFPGAEERLGRLAESVAALRKLWAGDPVSAQGRWVQLDDAISTPAPVATPRVVVGVGGSRRTLDAARAFADELNVYAGPDLIEAAMAGQRGDGGRPSVSVFLSWEWDKWPADPAAELRNLEQRGASRAFVSLGAELPVMVERIASLAALMGPE